MENKFKFGVIGAGFMSSAIVSGAIRSKFLLPSQIIVSDINQPALTKFENQNVNVTTDNSYVFNNAEYVLLAVKPQHFAEAVKGVQNSACDKIISIMAGVKKLTVKSAFNGSKIKVVRCMPNTPCSVGNGAIGVDLSDFNDENDKKFVSELFSSFAKLVFVDESKLNAVTGISGSSPAYFYLFIKNLVESGVKNGLNYEDAKTLAVNTMIGSGKMIFENSGKSLDELINGFPILVFFHCRAQRKIFVTFCSIFHTPFRVVCEAKAIRNSGEFRRMASLNPERDGWKKDFSVEKKLVRDILQKIHLKIYF